MRGVSFGLDDVRVFLHVLSVTVWVGGQIVLGAIVPILRASGVEALPRQVARRFAQVSWPSFGIALVTGMWSVIEAGTDLATSYHVTLGVKVLLVLLSGAAAALHSTTSSAAVRGATGAIGLVAALAALFCGVLLSG
jgi:putative copper export protein